MFKCKCGFESNNDSEIDDHYGSGSCPRMDLKDIPLDDGMPDWIDMMKGEHEANNGLECPLCGCNAVDDNGHCHACDNDFTEMI